VGRIHWLNLLEVRRSYDEITLASGIVFRSLLTLTAIHLNH